MKLKLIIGSLFFTQFIFAQVELKLHGGLCVNRLQFPAFQNFVDSYNLEQAQFNDILSPLEFKQIGYGFDFGGQVIWSRFVFGFGGSETRTLPSEATFKNSYSRGIQFRGYTFDMILGGKIGNVETNVIPYLDFGTQALHIHSWFDYDGIKSYGTEGRYNGVWTSWKLLGAIGVKFQHTFDRFGFYVDLNAPLRMSTVNGGTFTHSDNTTSGGYFFPKLAGEPTFEPANSLPQAYRNIRLSMGVVINIIQ
jgi:hypothetical protein